MQNRAASQGTDSLPFDHIMSQVNKLFYLLEDNGSQNAKYKNRNKLESWMICSYDELTQEILQRMKWGNIQVGQEHIFTQRDMDKIAFDTRSGQLYRLTPPIRGDASISALDVLSAQLGELNLTPDKRSLASK